MNPVPILRKSVLALAAMAMLPLAAQAQTKEPIRIGAVTSISGVFAQQGEEVMRGIQFAVDQANKNNGVDGRKVEIKTGDDESTPDAGRRTAEKLARDGYNLLVGPIASSISLAIGQNLDRWNAMFVVTIAKADKITGDTCKKRMFRTNNSDSMDLAMIGEWMKDIKEKNFAIVAADYVWGRDSAAAFAEAAKAQGKNVELTLFPPLGTKDFAPYISQITANSKVDGIWVALVGRDLIAYTKQAQEFGLTSKRTLGHAMIMNFVVDATGDATKGMWGNMGYGAEIDTPMNKAFVKAWQAQFNRVPTDNEGQAYNGVQAIFEGVRKSGSVKPVDVSKALSGATYDTIYGNVTMRAQDHQLVIPNYVGQVKEVDGKFRPVIEQSFDVGLVPPASPLCKM